MSTWPRLSITLTHARHPSICQACGQEGVTRWQEHDDNDKPEPIAVVLCEACAKLLIEPHPRMYRQMPAGEPFPGAMPVCERCRHRDALACLHPDLKANGGAGLALRFPTPTFAFVCRRGGRGGPMTIYHGGVTCDGCDELPAEVQA